MTPEGERLGSTVRIDNDPFELARLVASWGESPEVVLEATYGWYWAADVLAEAWVAPPDVRGLREAVRHRCKLVALRCGLKAQVHAVLAKQGVHVPMSDLFGVGGTTLLDQLALDAPFHARVLSLRRLIDAFTFEIDIVAERTCGQLARHPGFQAVQTIPGVGPVLGAVFLAEIGDVTRFCRPEKLCC